MQKRIIRTAVIVGLILLTPFLGNLFIKGWNWNFFDFLVMGILLFLTGLAIDFSVRKFPKPIHKIGAVIVIVAVLVLIWTELAVNAVSRSLHSL